MSKSKLNGVNPQVPTTLFPKAQNSVKTIECLSAPLGRKSAKSGLPKKHVHSFSNIVKDLAHSISCLKIKMPGAEMNQLGHFEAKPLF